MLTYRPERARFVARHGFDPVADLAVPAAGSDETRSRAVVDAIVGRLASSDLPVFLFLPEVPSVRLLRPTPDSSSTP